MRTVIFLGLLMIADAIGAGTNWSHPGWILPIEESRIVWWMAGALSMALGMDIVEFIREMK